jgi:hypothetical protein
MSVNELTPSKLSMSWAINELAFHDLAVDEMAVDELTPHPNCPCQIFPEAVFLVVCDPSVNGL